MKLSMNSILVGLSLVTLFIVGCAPNKDKANRPVRVSPTLRMTSKPARADGQAASVDTTKVLPNIEPTVVKSPSEAPEAIVEVSTKKCRITNEKEKLSAEQVAETFCDAAFVETKSDGTITIKQRVDLDNQDTHKAAKDSDIKIAGKRVSISFVSKQSADVNEGKDILYLTYMLGHKRDDIDASTIEVFINGVLLPPTNNDKNFVVKNDETAGKAVITFQNLELFENINFSLKINYDLK